MCTVTYIPGTGNDFFLTSNRDERIARPTSPPVFKLLNDQTVWFPKDLEAGGTWIAASENGRTCCLLNGGFENHIRKPPYARSRGLILLEAFRFEKIDAFYDSVELENVEPFTLITTEAKADQPLRLSQFVWDGNKRSIEERNAYQPSIWCSATLYDRATREKRQEVFARWIAAHPSPSGESILHFHANRYPEQDERNMFLGLHNGLQTVSITQVQQDPLFTRMNYIDMLKNSSSQNLLESAYEVSLR